MPLVMNSLSQTFEKLAAFVPDEKELSESWLGAVLMLTSFSWHTLFGLLGVGVVPLYPSILRCLTVSHSALRPVPFELLEDLVGRTGCDLRHNSPKVLVCLLPRAVGSDV